MKRNIKENSKNKYNNNISKIMHQRYAAQTTKYLSAPKMSLALNQLNSAIPVIGRYSLEVDLKFIENHENSCAITA